MNALRGTMRLVLAFACVSLLPSVAPGATAIDSPREVHGSADAFAEPGVALAWGVLRGADEASTRVVIRIDADPRVYAFVAVAGVDPFTRARQPLLPVTPVGGSLDFRSPRSRFADLPRSELRFYRSAVAVEADTPSLVVYYLGIPDTAPEFANETKLDAYLGDRIGRARKESGGKAP